MAERTLAASFEDLQPASDAVQVLYRAGFDPATISVTGRNSGDFAGSLSGALSAGTDGYLVFSAVVGALLGGALAFCLLTCFPDPGLSLTVGSLIAILCGAAGGAVIGVLSAAVIFSDVASAFGEAGQGRSARGKALLMIQCKNIIERYHAETILEEFGAIEIYSRANGARSDKLTAAR